MRKIQALCRIKQLAAVFAIVLACGAHAAPDILVAPVANLRDDFIMGADISILAQMEQRGARYADIQGERKDFFQILQENGVNWVRLRLWHTPVNGSDVIENGRTIARRGEPMGGGNNDLATTVKLAKRAKAMGFKLLLDIHYSDFWADPDKQNKPTAWAKLKGQALEKAVYAYTKDVLDTLQRENAFPNMVQVGNELNGGMLWPDGKTWKGTSDDVIGGEAGFVALLRQGIQAVRDADPHRDTPQHVKLAVHLADGGKNELYRRVFDLLTQNNVDYDVIGLSFYPYWHGPIWDLQNNADDIASRYGKEVVVMETAYAYTTANGDEWPNLFNPDMPKSAGYKATVQGQASVVRDVIEAMANVPGQRGLGVFYWEPGWYPVRGVGWRTGEGNAWENQAMFNFNGQALPSLAVFKRVRDSAGVAPVVLDQGPLKLSAYVGERWEPPVAVKLAYSDDAERQAFVSWDELPPKGLDQPGSFVLNGQVEGLPIAVKAEVTVIPRRNLVEDTGFESGDLKYWTLTGSTAAASNERNPGNAHSGVRSLHYWSGEPFQFNVERTFKGIKNGTYVLKGWAAGGGGEKTLEMYSRDCGESPRKAASWSNTGWQKWSQATVKGIAVTNGTCTIGIHVDAKAGVWGNVDDIEFMREE